MKSRTGLGVVFLVLAAVWSAWNEPTQAAIYQWTGSAGDSQWTSANNWNPNTGYPSSTSDDALFSTNVNVAVDVNADITIRYLMPSNTYVTNTFTIATGRTFSPYYLQGHNGSRTNTVIIQGGTFKPRTSLIVGQQTTAGPRATNEVYLVVTNTIFDTENLTNGIYVGYNNWTVGYTYGSLDGQGATFHHKGVPNILKVPQLWLAPGMRGNNNSALLRLPPSITNITVNSLYMRGISDFDLGDQPQLETVVISNEALIGRGYIVYRDGSGNTFTNLPPNVELKIGTPGTPAAFDFGVMYDTALIMRWGGFRRFEGYFSRVNIGQCQNSLSAYAELDLASVGELAGDFTAERVATPILRLGGGSRYGTGVLRLPSTVTNLAFDIFELGNVPELYAPPSSVLHLGSNTQLRAFTVRDSFVIGRGQFEFTTADGHPRTNLPGGVVFKVGTPDRRASLRVGNCIYLGSTSLLGPGIASFEGWLNELLIGHVGPLYANHAITATLDLRGVDVIALDVQSNVTIGAHFNNASTCYLYSASMRCANLTVGSNAHSTLSYNRESFLHLSNTVATVTNSVTIRETGRVAVRVDGRSSGLDLLATNLTVAPPSVFPQYYGRISVVFSRDPLSPSEDYFGVRLRGNAVALLQSLTSAVPPRLTADIAGLSPSVRSRFGIYYLAGRDQTILGVPGVPSGTVILIR